MQREQRYRFCECFIASSQWPLANDLGCAYQVSDSESLGNSESNNEHDIRWELTIVGFKEPTDEKMFIDGTFEYHLEPILDLKLMCFFKDMA